ncbi:MAG: Uma2 family endonuclease [Candidatus Saccharimonas sp.]|nr:Uma2 family endonuclease [Planctomycetaceae bacterium]
MWPDGPRLTRDQYYQLYESGCFNEVRVELIEGYLIDKGRQSPAHAMSVSLTHEHLREMFSDGWWCRNQAPLHLTEYSAPDADAAVVPGNVRDYSDHPTTAELVVEVSDTSLQLDLSMKAELYAQAVVPEYWVVDLVHRQLIVHRQPKRPSSGTARYEEVTVYEADAAVKPLAKPRASVKVADLLP